ncbi:MAG TPA: hypothetical protein VFS62_14165 [Chloroflexota bacterium]|nr:hypothetical protein [Chloroflexota bacterium]
MRYAFLIGEGIGHSLSPPMHNAGYRALGLSQEFQYELLDVPRSGLASAFGRVREADCAGTNVTMPYKPDAAAVADARAPEVDRCRMANVLLNDGGRLTARNVDIEAMVRCFRRRGAAIRGGVALVLGSGGAAAGALEALRAVAPASIALAARNPATSQGLADGSRLDVSLHTLDDVPELASQAALVINATPLGMSPDDPLPLPAEALRPGMLIYDLVYSRRGPTALVSAALEAGALVCDGLTHVYEQALPSFELFTGRPAPEEAMRQAVIETLGGRQPVDWGAE